jgi:hypothetical protein
MSSLGDILVSVGVIASVVVARESLRCYTSANQ